MAARVAVVTGGTKGLGRALSLALAERGFEVVALYHADDTAAAALLAEWQARGATGRCLKCDVAGGALDFAIGPSVDELVLVHNAVTPFEPRPFHLTSETEFEAQWAVAARGFVRCVQALLRPMTRARRSTVVAVGTRAPFDAPPRGFSAYAAGKAALSSLAQSLAAEHGPRGLRVLQVRPGFMQTGLTAAWDAAFQAAGHRAGDSDPAAAAQTIAALIARDDLPARGETYDV